jgi:pimeloyl-ACP methyl ester carboxylesterase
MAKGRATKLLPAEFNGSRRFFTRSARDKAREILETSNWNKVQKMTFDNTDDSVDLPDALKDTRNYLVGRGNGCLLLNGGPLDVIMQMPLPGIVIFVHGVNSDGEWYADAEKGLCAGLNERLKRGAEFMKHPTVEGGVLTPANYMRALTDDGYVNPDMRSNSFIEERGHFSPVIRFRWGYTANAEELKQFGDGIYLNEWNYWGGGPFANGCTSLPDLWSEGLSDNLFLWLTVQHLNPSNDRNVFSCPPRPYFVLAAFRLAKLVESIRKKQADVPITIVCHSQGNMIGIAAAFLGNRQSSVTDVTGIEGRCVADNYVLCNPPYSLLKSNTAENWTQSSMTDRHGSTGRQTEKARTDTLRAFFDIIRKPAAKLQDVEAIDKFMGNKAHGFSVDSDRKQYGYGTHGSTCCRVTLYCNPHDEVISTTSIQGIGWRGLSNEEIQATGGADLFCQRVFAQGFTVGVKGKYHYWADHYKKPSPGSHKFWVPESQKAGYSLGKGLDANRGNPFGKVMTVLGAPLLVVATKLAGVRINALPDKNWEIPLEGPDLPSPFEPQSVRFGNASEQFDQGFDAPGQYRDSKRERDADDPYAGDRNLPGRSGVVSVETTDAAKGDRESEAALRYEDHARLRMQAKREGLVGKGEKAIEEDSLSVASVDYKAWRNNKIKANLAVNIDTHATDHSTIMTNEMHAQKALAYDVAVGFCKISQLDLHELRKIADWRFVDGLDKSNPNRAFEKYFTIGYFNGLSPAAWVKANGSEGSMPNDIEDRRENSASKTKSA